jgi:glutamate--cysteine ligase
LRARGRHSAEGRDESTFLGPLEAIAAGEPTQAEQWLARYHQAWQGDVRTIFREAAI